MHFVKLVHLHIYAVHHRTQTVLHVHLCYTLIHTAVHTYIYVIHIVHQSDYMYICVIHSYTMPYTCTFMSYTSYTNRLPEHSCYTFVHNAMHMHSYFTHIVHQSDYTYICFIHSYIMPYTCTVMSYTSYIIRFTCTIVLYIRTSCALHVPFLYTCMFVDSSAVLQTLTFYNVRPDFTWRLFYAFRPIYTWCVHIY